MQLPTASFALCALYRDQQEPLKRLWLLLLLRVHTGCEASPRAWNLSLVSWSWANRLPSVGTHGASEVGCCLERPQLLTAK
jgi:hypothetical protein